MNTHISENIPAAPRTLRDTILDARTASGRTEKEINREYRRHMKEEGREAPKSIMRKVRDKRRVFSLDEVEARCLAKALDISPSWLTNREPTMPKPHPLATEAPPRRPRPPEDIDHTAFDREAKAIRETPHTSLNNHPLDVGFRDVEGSLHFSISTTLSSAQFDRLTLAIPAYMMRTTRKGDAIHCQADVPIFPYQAELIMRAIYGGR